MADLDDFEQDDPRCVNCGELEEDCECAGGFEESDDDFDDEDDEDDDDEFFDSSDQFDDDEDEEEDEYNPSMRFQNWLRTH
jgi:ribonuclease E